MHHSARTRAIRCARCAWLAFFLLCATFAAPSLFSSSAAKDSTPARLQSIESAIQAATFSPRAVPVLVRGIVISNRRRIVIEDRTGATEVLPTSGDKIALGDEVEVSGEMVLSPEPLIRHGQLRRLWGGSMPPPLSITPDEAADGENELFLVQTVAVLSDITPAGLTGVRLNLRGAHQNFSAVLDSDSLQGDLPSRSLQAGATLRITGILVVTHGADAGQGNAFTLQLRGPDDIELIEPPSWWTGPHMLLVGGIAIILILAAIIGFNRMEHERFRVVAEERANIARDIHDTLAQGYAGITLQLEAAQQVIERDPARAGLLLNEALQLVRHSRDESHVSIDILRSLSRDDRLDVLLARCIRQLQGGSKARIEQQVAGPPVSLPYKIVNNLYRIVQEALSNAVKHARASTIVVRVGYRKEGVSVEVEDNGCGFQQDSIAGPEQGHFGIVGMRERCAAISALFELESNASGTLVRVRADL